MPQGSGEPYHMPQDSSPRNSTSSYSSVHSSKSSSESSNHSTITEDEKEATLEDLVQKAREGRGMFDSQFHLIFAVIYD